MFRLVYCGGCKSYIVVDDPKTDKANIQCERCDKTIFNSEIAISTFNTLMRGRYKILEILSKSSKEAMMLVKDHNLDCKCLIEMVFIYDNKESRQIINRIKAKVQALAKLKHERLPLLKNFFCERNNLFIIMEYFEGKSLAKIYEDFFSCFVSNLKLETQLLRWFLEIIVILEYLHSKDIVYGSFWPENILASDDGFNFANLGAIDEYILFSQKDTLKYIAPEGVLTKKSDIFSLGAMLVHLLTGKHLKDLSDLGDHSYDINDILEKNQSKINPLPTISDKLAKLIMKMTQQDPSKRPSLDKIKKLVGNILNDLKQTKGRPIKKCSHTDKIEISCFIRGKKHYQMFSCSKCNTITIGKLQEETTKGFRAHCNVYCQACGEFLRENDYGSSLMD